MSKFCNMAARFCHYDGKAGYDDDGKVLPLYDDGKALLQSFDIVDDGNDAIAFLPQ